VNNPATGELLVNVPFMGGVETPHAIAAGSEADTQEATKVLATGFMKSLLQRREVGLLLGHHRSFFHPQSSLLNCLQRMMPMNFPNVEETKSKKPQSKPHELQIEPENPTSSKSALSRSDFVDEETTI